MLEISYLIYGKRIDKDTYSKYISDWLYDELLSINKLSKNSVIRLISEASIIESNSNNYNKESIITRSSFEKVLNKLSNM